MKRSTSSRSAKAALALFLIVASAMTAIAADPSLDRWIASETKVASEKLAASFTPQGGDRGAVIASPSTKDPDYYYHWVRDGALVADVVLTFRERGVDSADTYLGLLKDYAAFSRKTQMATSLQGAGLGEPKFYVSGAVYEKDWGRPQNDGPAARAIAMVRFTDQLLKSGDRDYVTTLYDGKIPTSSLIKADLEYVAHQWTSKDVDLWEEIRGCHFFTRMLQRRALLEGARLAQRLDDGGAAVYYREQAALLASSLEKHWSPRRQMIVATLDIEGNNFKAHQLDTSILLASIRADAENDRLFPPSDDRILATAAKIARISRALYTINLNRSDDRERAIQPAVGRYLEDMYDGINRGNLTLGNPWFLTTAAMAELSYRVASDWTSAQRIPVTPLNLEFLQSAIACEGSMVQLAVDQPVSQNDPRFRQILLALIEQGDGYLRRVQKHCDQNDGSLSEQMDRENGLMYGAKDLTWSYAAILTAFQAREEALQKIAALERPQPQPVSTGFHQ